MDQVVFEVADHSFRASDPSESLYYDVLEDTDINAWTVDLYGTRNLAGTSDQGIQFQFGVRFADFDNDYHAVAGNGDVGGMRLDASSNYGLMLGPIVGFSGNVDLGRSSLEGYIGQSVVLGSPELSNRTREFTGPFSEEPEYFSEEAFRSDKDIAIPITDLRLEWMYELSRLFSLGVGANASIWWDVSVPPGVIPGEGGNEVLHENTLVFYGALAFVEVRF